MLLFANLISGSDKDAFLAKVESISNDLGYNANWLMAIMHSETGGTFSAKAKNPLSGATGLIQFMPTTAQWLGTSTSALYNMSRMAQLDYVYLYFKKWKDQGKVATGYTDLYMIVFYPYAVGRADSFILGSEVSDSMARRIADLNNFDYNNDGYISVAEFKQFVYRQYIMKYVPDNLLHLLESPAGIFTGSSIGLLALLGIALYKIIKK